jgi:hypothetical protein
MDRQTFDGLVEDLQTQGREILESKGRDYTRDDADRLINFKKIADEMGVDPLLVWWVYFRKHIDAIATHVKTGKAESEPIVTRFIDAQNYLYLGYALIKEAKDRKVATEEVKAKLAQAKTMQGPRPSGLGTGTFCCLCTCTP